MAGCKTDIPGWTLCKLASGAMSEVRSQQYYTTLTRAAQGFVGRSETEISQFKNIALSNWSLCKTALKLAMNIRDFFSWDVERGKGFYTDLMGEAVLGGLACAMVGLLVNNLAIEFVTTAPRPGFLFFTAASLAAFAPLKFISKLIGLHLARKNFLLKNILNN